MSRTPFVVIALIAIAFALGAVVPTPDPGPLPTTMSNDTPTLKGTE